MSIIELQERARQSLVEEFWLYKFWKESPWPWVRGLALRAKTKALINYDRRSTGREPRKI